LPKVALDTSVIIEYIDKKSEFQDQAKAVFAALLNGTLEAVIPHPVLSETYYVTAKIYQKLGIPNPQELSSELVEWLFRLPTATIPSENRDLAVEAGKVKLENCIALTDCYVLAASKIYGCKAIFKKPEQEMLLKLNRQKKSYQLVFLSDYK
jgi:hypothetical protein